MDSRDYRRMHRLRNLRRPADLACIQGMKIHLICHIPTGEWTIFGCQTVPIGCDQCVIRSQRILVLFAVGGVEALCELEKKRRLAKNSTFGSATPG